MKQPGAIDVPAVNQPLSNPPRSLDEPRHAKRSTLAFCSLRSEDRSKEEGEEGRLHSAAEMPRPRTMKVAFMRFPPAIESDKVATTSPNCPGPPVLAGVILLLHLHFCRPVVDHFLLYSPLHGGGYIYLCIYIYIYIYINIYMNMDICVYIYMYAYMYRCSSVATTSHLA